MSIEKLETVTNNFLDKVRDLEYQLVHFINKTNKSTALDIRNCSRELQEFQKSFKKISIEFYKEDESIDDQSDNKK